MGEVCECSRWEEKYKTPSQQGLQTLQVSFIQLDPALKAHLSETTYTNLLISRILIVRTKSFYESHLCMVLLLLISTPLVF